MFLLFGHITFKVVHGYDLIASSEFLKQCFREAAPIIQNQSDTSAVQSDDHGKYVGIIPSPLSLALNTMNTYLMSGIIVSVYKIKDKTPNISSSLSCKLCLPEKVLRNTYRGEVLSSP